jgi:hypothetical protein
LTRAFLALFDLDGTLSLTPDGVYGAALVDSALPSILQDLAP